MIGKTMTLEEAYSHCRDRHDYPKVIEDISGLDIVLPGYVTRIGKHNKEKRRIVLEVTTYGVEHFYGNLKADGIDFLQTDEEGRTYNVWDSNVYDIQKKYPLANSKYDIDLVRPLTEEEISKYPSRWEGYYPGDFTNAFYTPKEIIDLAIQVCKARFKGDWQLEWEDPYTYDIKTLEL